jgi:hypothetical protein
MKKRRVTEEQIIGVPKQHEAGRNVPEFITYLIPLVARRRIARANRHCTRPAPIFPIIPFVKPLPITVAAE